MSKQCVTIYSDGSCLGNPGPGGWAAILRCAGHEKVLSGSVSSTTNQRMELTAILRAFEALKPPCDVVLYTDSQYAQKGINLWRHQWRIHGWCRKRSSGSKTLLPLANADLWQALDTSLSNITINAIYVPAHRGIELNERVDMLARSCAQMVVESSNESYDS